MAPSDTTYFNYWQSRAVRGSPVTRATFRGPRCSRSIRAGLRLGGEGALWTEYVRSSEEVDTLLLPRLAALSEALWSGAARLVRARRSPGAASFPARFTRSVRCSMRATCVTSSSRPWGLRAKKVFVETATLELARPAIHPDGVVRFTLDGSDPTASSPVYDAPIVLRATTSATARLFLPGGRNERRRARHVRALGAASADPAVDGSFDAA